MRRERGSWNLGVVVVAAGDGLVVRRAPTLAPRGVSRLGVVVARLLRDDEEPASDAPRGERRARGRRVEHGGGEETTRFVRR